MNILEIKFQIEIKHNEILAKNGNCEEQHHWYKMGEFLNNIADPKIKITEIKRYCRDVISNYNLNEEQFSMLKYILKNIFIQTNNDRYISEINTLIAYRPSKCIDFLTHEDGSRITNIIANGNNFVAKHNSGKGYYDVSNKINEKIKELKINQMVNWDNEKFIRDAFGCNVTLYDRNYHGFSELRPLLKGSKPDIVIEFDKPACEIINHSKILSDINIINRVFYDTHVDIEAKIKGYVQVRPNINNNIIFVHKSSKFINKDGTFDRKKIKKYVDL